MTRLPALGAAALLAALPAAVHAQSSTSQTTDVVVKENTTVVVKEAPKPSPVTFTPYGFFVLNAFFNDSLGNRNYPLPAQCPAGGAACEGNVIFDVRQTRLGARLVFDDKAGWTKATLAGLVEVDFQGGYAGAVPTSSIGFYSPVLRLRKAYADATWGGESKLTLRIGQDDIVTSLARPVSLAYIANPLFQFAGTLNGRAPMIALRYDRTPKDGIGASAILAAVSPQDNTPCDAATPSATACTISPGVAVDLGAGNRSRVPSFQAKLGGAWRAGGKNVATLNLWGGWQKNRFVNPATNSNVDVNSYIYGADASATVWWVTALGSIYQGYGWDQPGSLGASQGIAIGVARSAGPTSPFEITKTEAVKAFSGWFQILVGPSDLAQIYGGWGGTQSPADAYTGTLLAANSTRIQNFQWAAGLIGYAGKNWRFSAEYSRATSFFWNATSYSQGQFSLNSQLVF